MDFSFQLLEGEVLPPQHGFGVNSFPVVYRQHIYFCSGRDERETFMQCPSRFLKQPSPKPVVPIKMAIIGPPKSGKTGCKFEYILIITCKVIDVLLPSLLLQFLFLLHPT